MAKIYDIVTYNGEKELFDLRYNILNEGVDAFIVIEFDKTFSGRKKEPTFDYRATTKPIWYHLITESTYSKYKELALSSPNTEYGKGAEHWITEFMQKESIKDALHLEDDDLLFIGDVDEIWNPQDLNYYKTAQEPEKLKLQVYTYYLNNRSTEPFWGTLVTRYKWVKDSCLNHIRTNSKRSEGKYGWHFTSLKDNLKKKLEDSYTDETYATAQILNNLEWNIENNNDFLGRNFTYTQFEEDWPLYLKDNRVKYEHLMKF